MGQNWCIDEDHLLHWDGQPLVPYGTFSTDPQNQYGLDYTNIWIDTDFVGSTAEHVADLERQMEEACQAGLGVLLQFSIVGPRNWPNYPVNASSLFDDDVRASIVQKWSEYASVTQHPCLRGLTLWNEINTWDWEDLHTSVEYGEVLGQYANEMRDLIAVGGQVPILFKIAADWNITAVIEGAKQADGLLIDVWPQEPDDPVSGWIFREVWNQLENGQAHTTWFVVGEGGKGRVNVEDCAASKYWDLWPPFLSEAEALGIMSNYAEYGAKGVIYNGPFTTGPTDSASCSYESSYEYLCDIKASVVQQMIQTGRDVDFGNLGPDRPAGSCPPLQCP